LVLEGKKKRGKQKKKMKKKRRLFTFFLEGKKKGDFLAGTETTILYEEKQK
jgi:hypothetical protein